MPPDHDNQTLDLLELSRIRDSLKEIEKITQSDIYPQDKEILFQVGAVRNHAERLGNLMDALKKLVEKKQKFCEHQSKVRTDFNKMLTTRVCPDCRLVIVESTVVAPQKKHHVCAAA